MKNGLALLLLVSWLAPAWAQPMVSFTAGQVGITDSLERPQWYGLEYHGAPATRFEVAPGGGVARAACGATFVHVNFRKSFWLTRHWGLMHHFGPGYFIESEQIRLGHQLQFRSGLELVYRTRGDALFAFGITHLSNAGIGYPNPGTETLAFTYALPL